MRIKFNDDRLWKETAISTNNNNNKNNQERSHVSKIGDMSIFPLLSLQTSNYSGQRRRGERNGEVSSSPSRLRGLGERCKLPLSAPAENDFGAFHVQFYAMYGVF